MAENQNISILRHNQIRRLWHKEQWYYSILDVIAVLTDSKRPDIYWLTLKKRLKSERFKVATAQIEHLQLDSADGRLRDTVVANRQTILRLIQSIPSSKAMPLHQWLAQVGEERLEEIESQNKILDHLKAAYRARGYSQDWIEQRLRKALKNGYLLNEWQKRGVNEEGQLDILLDEIQNGIFEAGLPVCQEHTSLPSKVNLGANTSSVEAALISLGEAIAIMLHQDHNSRGFDELQQDVKEAGEAVGNARLLLEAVLGYSMINTSFQSEEDKTRQLSMFDKN